MTDQLSARKRIPEVAKQICSELGLPEDDAQTLTVAAILVQFHQDVECDVVARYPDPPPAPESERPAP